MASTVAETHRVLDQKDGCILKNPMSCDRSQDLFDSFFEAGLKLTDEQYNELLHMLAKANLPISREVDGFQGFCISDEFGPILAGARCKRELSDPGNRIPNGNRNPADMNQAPGAIDNNVAADNNGHIENGNEDGGNANDTVAGEDGGGDGDGGDGDGGDGDGGGDGVEQKLKIYRYELRRGDMRIYFMERFNPEIIADEYQSWDYLAQDILTEWREVAPGRMNYVVNNVTPANCWPRAETIFGHRINGLSFQSLNWRFIDNFADMRRHINCLLVIENMNGFADNGVAHADDNDIIGDGQIRTYLYLFDHVHMEINLAEHFNVSTVNGAAFGSWDDVARELFMRFQLRFGLPLVEHEVNAATCWPGADTIFGCLEHGRFQSLNWPSHEWEDVRQQLNCLLLIVYQ